jgi:hypothetical protein
MQTQPAHEAPPKKKITRRVMLPESTVASKEAADAADARLTRWGISPSYHINLSHLVGNRWTGHNEILPRRLYRFDVVRPEGINERRSRLDEEDSTKESALMVEARQPRTCAEDVQAIAGERRFVVCESVKGRDDAEELWEVIYPVETEARIWMMTTEHARKPWVKGEAVEPHLVEYFQQEGIEKPYKTEGHALAEFILHLEREAGGLVDAEENGLNAEQRELAHAMIDEVLRGAYDAHAHRAARLGATFGSMQERQNTGTGKKRLDQHDEECLAETGIVPPAEKPVEASQKMGEAVGQQFAESANKSTERLAETVEKIAEAQAETQKIVAQQGQLMATATMVLSAMAERLGLVPPADSAQQ